MRVRVRGIHTTALTHLLRLRDGFEVVHPSPSIRRRFDDGTDFDVDEPDVEIEDSDDRLGIVVHSTSLTDSGSARDEVVEAIGSIADGVFVWDDPTPRGSIYNAVVDDTLGSGAVISLSDDEEGFIPYSNADGHIGEGDCLRVQVVEPFAPWESKNPVVSTHLRVPGALCELRRGENGVDVEGDEGTARQMARMTEMLSAEIPPNWGVRYTRNAPDMDMGTLENALESRVRRAERIADALEDAPSPDDTGDAPLHIVSPERTVWIWFG
ncbi:MAG: RNA-binding protein, partial [Halobacteria archaeon]|nr:RNA-binding protein [Halobacteria archaeon]